MNGECLQCHFLKCHRSSLHLLKRSKTLTTSSSIQFIQKNTPDIQRTQSLTIARTIPTFPVYKHLDNSWYQNVFYYGRMKFNFIIRYLNFAHHLSKTGLINLQFKFIKNIQMQILSPERWQKLQTFIYQKDFPIL